MESQMHKIIMTSNSIRLDYKFNKKLCLYDEIPVLCKWCICTPSQNTWSENARLDNQKNIKKERFGQRYKLKKSRPVNYDESKTLLIKGLFCIKLWKIIKDNEVLVNIYEAMFSRSTKATYIWSLKRKESKLMNIWFSNSASLITAKASLGDIFAAETSRFVNKNLLSSF